MATFFHNGPDRFRPYIISKRQNLLNWRVFEYLFFSLVVVSFVNDAAVFSKLFKFDQKQEMKLQNCINIDEAHHSSLIISI